jgi:Fe-S oxidoreductase
VSALKDDYVDLAPGEDAQAVAGATWAIEDWLARAATLPAGVGRGQVLLHGHCHQKALWGTASARAVLVKLGFEVKEIESTCCGMAGAFGYEAEHVEMSKKIGELSVLPAVRAAAPDVRIAAAGTSCRDQMAQAAGREARHPIEWIAEALS